MQTHKAKRLAIIIESIMQARLTDILKEKGVTGWTVLPVLGGSGRSGEWSREGQVSRASGMVQVVCIIKPERLEPLLDDILKVVDRHIGVVTIGDVEVLRAERF